MFLNPIMLAGLGGAMLPLVLHFLSRARYTRVDFGAMMFLMPALAPRSRHGARLKELILLVTRMAIVAGLAVAFARPVLRAAGSPAIGEGARVSVVIVLDRSASMSHEENGTSRIEQAKSAAINVLANLRRGDGASIIVTGDLSGESSDLATPTSDLQSLASRLDEMHASTGRADIAAALMQGARVFQAEKSVNRELYIICDRQAIGWNGVDEPFASAWRNGMLRDGAMPRVYLIPVGGSQSENVAIESMTLHGPPLVRGQTGELEIRVHNFGEQPRTAIPLTISTGDGARELYRGLVNMPAKSTESVSAAVRFASAGSHVITASTSPAGFRSDDQMELAVDVMEPVKVLAIDADEHDRNENSPDFLALALEPFRNAGERGADPVMFSRTSIDRWPDPLLERPDVIVLDDVPLLQDQQVRALEQFVYTGGGLVVSAGASSQIDNYDRMLFKEYTGLLPARPREPAIGSAAPSTHLSALDSTSPIFDFVNKDKSEVPLHDIVVQKYVPVSDRVGARILASYANGEPFLLERAYGRGHVIFATTSLTGQWNSLPRSNFYLPLMQSMVRWLARPDQPPRNLSPGQPIEIEVAGPLRGRIAAIALPGGAVRQIELAPAGDRSHARFTDTRAPGRYTFRAPIQGRDEAVQHFIVRAPREESDPTTLTEVRWQWIENALGARRLDPERAALSAIIAKQRGGRELFLPIAALVGALLILEVGLTRFWSASDAR